MKLSKEEKALVASARAERAALRRPRWTKTEHSDWNYVLGDVLLGSVAWNDGDYNVHHEGWWALVPGQDMEQFEDLIDAKAFVQEHANLKSVLRKLKEQRAELNASIKLLEENCK